MKNAANACKLVGHLVARLPKERTCKCGSALKHALITDRATIPHSVKKELRLLLGKYLGD
jgi:5'-methylthioadenosine phosphorylase